MRKTYLLNGFVAMALGLAAVGCTHDADYSEHSRKVQIIAEYNNVFVKVFGEPAADQDWGFGTSGTRAFSLSNDGEYWNGDHNCTQSTWTNKLNIKSQAEVEAEDAIDITENWDQWGNYGGPKGKIYYVPEGKTFELDLHWSIEFKEEGMALYNYGTITGMKQFNCGDYIVTFYNAGTIEDFWANSQRHTIINTGTLKLSDYANIGDLYNSGTLVLKAKYQQIWADWNNWSGEEYFMADVPNDIRIYSTGLVTTDEGAILDLKAVCDIHDKLYVDGDIKIQNGTSKYICNIECTGKVENVDGPLYVSNVVANDLEFDGNNMYLTQGGHIDVANTIKIYNSACHVYAVSSSNALVETKNFIFENENDFDRTFSDNVYFKVDGSIDMSNVTNGNVKHDYYANVAAYIAENGNPNDKLNAGTATGSPACGDTWTVGTPDEGDDDEWTFRCRIFAEDLTVSEASDFDFNDVVFDVYYNQDRTDTKIQLLAAGGTLPLTVDGTEVHAQFGLDNTTTMINTGDVDGVVNGLEADEYKLDRYVEPINIAIMVFKNGQWIELEAKEGKPAAKFAVADQSMEWCDERQNIDEKYNFSEWVKNPSNVLWYK